MANFAYDVFAAVVHHKTFVKAARELNITPSAVSHSIAGLEKQLGFALFQRKRSGAKLTPNGQKILPLIQEARNAELKISEAAAQINGLTTGHLRIGAFSSVCISWLPTIINQYKQDHDQINLSLNQGNFNRIVADVAVGDLDVGFAALPVQANLIVYPLVRDPIYCIAPHNFTPRNGKTITQADVANENFILQQIDYDRDTKLALDTYQVSSNSLHYSIDDASIIAMVESGLGLGILPELALDNLAGNYNRFAFEQPFARTLCLVTPKTGEQTPSITASVDLVKAYVKQHYPKERWAFS